MALDTKYRPRKYEDVLGQESSVSVLKQFIIEERGFHQSYVFCGQHGSGKTTMGRILARALLCHAPVDGEPCDKCSSCKIFLEGGLHPNFEELDAATRSGKGDLSKIIEDLNYSTFSGKRKIYLFDESHRLSKQALDALLKPMEDNIVGGEDKRLVCIFCTTEPEKMVSTIFSRCAPAFVIRAVSPEGIAERLAHICELEKVSYDMSSLVTIAEASECHIRDCLKMVEGVSMLGGISKETVSSYLQLGANDYVLDILKDLYSSLQVCVELSEKLSVEVSPTAAYERLAECSMVSYRNFLGVGKIPSQWDKGKIQELSKYGHKLLNISQRFASPPHRPTKQTLILDLATLHHSDALGIKDNSVVINFQTPKSAPTNETLTKAPFVTEKLNPKVSLPEKSSIIKGKKQFEAQTTSSGVWVDPRGVADSNAENKKSKKSNNLQPEVFREILLHHLRRSINGERW
jgi:DNA polymerase III subunit gamma/tau